jgi:hypothetical protein
VSCLQASRQHAAKATRSTPAHSLEGVLPNPIRLGSCEPPFAYFPIHMSRVCIMQVQLVAPGAMPKLGKGGTLASRQAILHRCAWPLPLWEHAVGQHLSTIQCGVLTGRMCAQTSCSLAAVRERSQTRQQGVGAAAMAQCTGKECWQRRYTNQSKQRGCAQVSARRQGKEDGCLTLHCDTNSCGSAAPTDTCHRVAASASDCKRYAAVAMVAVAAVPK